MAGVISVARDVKDSFVQRKSIYDEQYDDEYYQDNQGYYNEPYYNEPQYNTSYDDYEVENPYEDDEDFMLCIAAQRAARK